MAVERRKIRGEKNTGISIRITEEGFRRLKVLAALYNQSQANLIEDLLDDTYEREIKSDAKQVKEIEAKEGLKAKG